MTYTRLYFTFDPRRSGEIFFLATAPANTPFLVLDMLADNLRSTLPEGATLHQTDVPDYPEYLNLAPASPTLTAFENK